MSIILLTSVAFAQDAVSDYAAQRLDCWTESHFYAQTSIDDNGTISTRSGKYSYWGISDGRGNALDTAQFARAVGDETHLGELEARAADSKRSGKKFILSGLAIGAVGAAGAAVGWLTTLDAVSTGTLSNMPTPVLQGLSYGGSLVGAAGFSVAGIGMSRISSGTAPLYDVTRAYSYGLAKQRCDAYNDKLRQRLGLTPQDTIRIDTDNTGASAAAGSVPTPAISVFTAQP